MGSYRHEPRELVSARQTNEKPMKLHAADRVKMLLGLSVSGRTAQRIERVMAADVTLAGAMLNGWCKPGQAEDIINDLALHRKIRRMMKRARSRSSG